MQNLPDKIVLASNNQGKLVEFQHLFAEANLAISILPQSDFAVPDADETGLSFIENAILKARHASKISGLPALADDSGLAVPALGGAPGIFSARYAGKDKTNHDRASLNRANIDKANNAKLLADLAPFRQANQPIDAYFVCVLALVRHQADPLPIIAQGLWHGEILTSPIGEHGFGYDPLFCIPELQKSSAQLDKAHKSQISHRALALQALLENVS